MYYFACICCFLLYNVTKYQNAGDKRKRKWTQSRIQFYIPLGHIWLIKFETIFFKDIIDGRGVDYNVH